MAWFAVTSLMRTVELEFLFPEPRVLGHTEAAEALHGRLHELVDFLEKSENQFNADDVRMQDWKARLKGVALRIEDEIESKVINLYSGRQSRSTIAESFHSTLVYAIGELTKCVKEDLQVNDIVSSRERIESSSSSSSHPTALELQSTMVGRTAELEHIKRLLLEDKSTETLVAPIVGMAGIGKTTFARSLYQDPVVKSHFDVLAWATVSTSATYDRCRMLRELLLCIHPKQKEFIHQVKDDHLPDLVRKWLVGRRYLIVLDDIWDSNHWEEIKRSFPEDCNGSRILLTSRHDEVAVYARSYNYCFVNVPFLNSEESWNLFLQKIHPTRLLSEVEAIWRHIVSYFRGLPFATVIAAGLARAINESLWISKEIEGIFYERLCSDLVEGISKILILSYNNLPNFLKICFLYLGIFPESSAIHVKKLIQLWIAEGFVKVEGERSLEEVAEDFLKDLVSRSLVLIDKISMDGKIKTCKVHDIVHDFCKRKAMEEGLLRVVDGHFGHLHTYRWVSIETMNVSLDHISKKSRSIFSFCHDGVNRSIGLASFKKLRVLDLSNLCFKWNLFFTNGGVDLVLLRYLALRIYSSGYLKMLKLKETFINLQTLLFLVDKERRVSYFTTHVFEIWRMPMLRHLQFNPVFMFDTPSVVLKYLQTIYWLRPSQCTKKVFLGIQNVKVMGIFIPERKKEFVRDEYSLTEDSSDDDLKQKPHINSLTEKWWDDLICLQKLEKLKLNSDCDDPIILPHASAFPVQLRMLTLKGSLPPRDAMEVVGMLPNLEVLKLKFGACKGQHWKLSGGGFPKLKSLLIQGMKLKQWTATDNAFPILERLIIKHCVHLEKIPSTFVELYTLQLIELHGCHSLLVHSAEQIQQQQEELFGYNWLLVHHYNTTHQVATIIEEKEQAKRGQQECKKLKCKVSDPESSYFARQVQEEEDSKLSNVEFFNCFEDDFDNNDIN
ncbi:PREDICTED: putative late blight resistance protein homolog R1B-16 isoform X3 [Ipomoea nil]|uniref:putative late blight resistance protein homolog R1B-16 isoform X3 n=1 Tax=Ipomoea nil TaxID=35883 RepID=UPI000901538B|nr:PREDICTED: putative late blight resistance protein homolog R1B-16 isoform X3 [Ipomoea nil]